MAQDKFGYTLIFRFPNEQVVFWSSDVLELYFIEDIFSLSVTGRVQVIDIKGAIERIEGFTGDIGLSFIFYRENSETGEKTEMQSKTFYVYKLSGLTMDVTRKTKIYQILFADITYILFNKLHFSYSWQEKTTPDKIITDLCMKLAKCPHKQNLWETSDTEFECYLSPFWNIRQNLQYVAPRTRSQEHQVSGYCFFTASDLNAGYEINYVSLEKMLSSTEAIPTHNMFDFYQAQAPRPGAELDECRVSSWQVLSFDNANLDNIAGSTYFGYDPEIEKGPFKCEFTYTEAIEKTTILGNTSLFEEIRKTESGPDMKDSVDPAKPIKWYMTRDKDMLENLWYDDWVKRYCQAQMIEVVTLGTSKRKIGTLAELLVPRNFEWQPKGNEGFYDDPQIQELHPRWSGKALIKSITHYFTAKEPAYLQKVVLIKNGYEKAMGQGSGIQLLPAVKKNLGSGGVQNK